MPKTVVGVVLDRSGSMGPHTSQVIEGHNGQIRDIAENAGDQKVVVFRTLFDYPNRIQTTGPIPIDDVAPLDHTTYVPEGSTALNDAIGQTIEKMRTVKLGKKDAALLIIFTDGQENSSQKFTGAEIKSMIEGLEATDQWTVTYLGPRENLREVSQQYGINLSNMAGYDTASAVGTLSASATTSANTIQYMNLRSTGVTSTPTFANSVVGAAAVIDDDSEETKQHVNSFRSRVAKRSATPSSK